MRWLVTTGAGIDRADLQREMAPLQAQVDEVGPIPMDDELVFEVEGPVDLPARLEGRDSSVLRIHPDSSVEPYG